jgi:hypothetical protein
MIKALNPDAWCFITMFDNINPLSALIDPLAKRMQHAEERRINLIKELITVKIFRCFFKKLHYLIILKQLILYFLAVS